LRDGRDTADAHNSVGDVLRELRLENREKRMGDSVNGCDNGATFFKKSFSKLHSIVLQILKCTCFNLIYVLPNIINILCFKVANNVIV
jgi:hypothetical protein